METYLQIKTIITAFAVLVCLAYSATCLCYAFASSEGEKRLKYFGMSIFLAFLAHLLIDAISMFARLYPDIWAAMCE
jgi:ABC-type spermidine/putrescine transport system permease subunit I